MANDPTTLKERLKARLKKRVGASPAPAPQKTRCTNLEADQRVTQVVQWLVEGHGRQFILRLAADAWGIRTRQTETYLARAYDVLREENEREREELTALGVAQRDHLYRLALDAIGSVDAKERAALLSAARAILTDRDRLRALYATDRASLCIGSTET